MSDSDMVIEIPHSGTKRKPAPRYRLLQLLRTFGETLCQLRKRKGFTERTDLAAASDVKKDLIADIERGHETHRATVAILQKLAEALSCKLHLQDAEEEQYCGASVTLSELYKMGISPLFIDK